MSDPWEGILSPGEEIIWQGTPKSRVRLEWESPFIPLSYLFFTGFSIFWMVMASRHGGLFWTFGLLFFFVGAYGLIGVHFWKAFVRRHQHYTLTNQRAMIGTRILGRKTLKSYPIVQTTEIEFQDDGQTGDIYFASEETRRRNNTTVTKIGFEQIENPRSVLAQMRSLQDLP